MNKYSGANLNNYTAKHHFFHLNSLRTIHLKIRTAAPSIVLNSPASRDNCRNCTEIDAPYGD